MKKNIMLIAVGLIGMMSLAANAQDGPQNKMRQPREFTEYAFEGILLDINQQTRIDSLNDATKAKLEAERQARVDMKARGPKSEKCDKAACPEGKKCDKATCPEGKKCDKAACPEGKKCDKAACPEGKKCDKAACPEGKKCDKAACPEGKKCDKAACPEGKKCDKAACPEGKKCDKADMPRGKKIEGRGPCANPYGVEYIEKVKEILTPEQYTVFLENIATMPVQNPGMTREHRGPRVEKAVRGDRPAKHDKAVKRNGDGPAKKADKK